MRLLVGPDGATAATGDGVDLDKLYAYPAVTRDRPYVRANFVATLDGAVELDGTSDSLSAPGDKQVFSVLRGLCDVVLAGAGTVRSEQYGPAKPSPERRAARTAAGLSDAPVIAVLSGSADLDPTWPLFTEASCRTLVITAESADAGRRARLAEVADVAVAGDETVEVEGLLAALASRGLCRVLCEGGPGLLSRLGAAGKLDELCLTTSPTLAGPGHQQLVGGPEWPAASRFTLGHLLHDGDVLLARYLRRA